MKQFLTACDKHYQIVKDHHAASQRSNPAIARSKTSTHEALLATIFRSFRFGLTILMAGFLIVNPFLRKKLRPAFAGRVVRRFTCSRNRLGVVNFGARFFFFSILARQLKHGDDRDRTGNLCLARAALSQLSYVPDGPLSPTDINPRAAEPNARGQSCTRVGVLGFEPRTSSLSAMRSNQLSYTPPLPLEFSSRGLGVNGGGSFSLQVPLMTGFGGQRFGENWGFGAVQGKPTG